MGPRSRPRSPALHPRRPPLPVLLALAALLAPACDPGPSRPALAPVLTERPVLDLVAAFAAGDPAVSVLAEHPEQGLTAYAPANLDKDELVGTLASDQDQLVIHARAESAFRVTTPVLGAGARLAARTFVFPVDRRDPERADPAPVTFRVLVDGEAAAEISSAYVRDMSREHPFDQLMRTLEVDLSAHAGRSVALTFQTTRDGAPPPADGVAAEPAWWSLSLTEQRPVPRQVASPTAPHLLVVCVDTLAAGRLSTYGHERPTAPHLDALAARGTRFARAHSPSSWTLPSTASLLTGLAPNTHGVLGDARSYLMDALLTWPEVLRGAGLEGAAFVSNALISDANNFQQGFGTWVEDYGPGGDGDTDAVAMVDHLLAWLDGQPADARWFAYLHLMDPHAPYGAPGDHERRYVAPDFASERDFGGHLPRRLQVGAEAPLTADEQAHVADLYDGEVAYTDAELGRLLAGLAARGLDDRTLVVVTADHGEELFEYGRLGHGYALNEPMLAVPLILAGPLVPRGEVVQVPVNTASLANTLINLGAGPSAMDSHRAPPLLPLRPLRLRAEPTFALVRTQLFSDERQLLVSGRDAEGRKVVLDLGDDGALGADGGPPPVEHGQWFRLTGGPADEAAPLDPAQLAAQDRAAFEALQQATLGWYVASARARPQDVQPLTDNAAALRQVGYAGDDERDEDG